MKTQKQKAVTQRVNARAEDLSP